MAALSVAAFIQCIALWDLLDLGCAAANLASYF